MNIPNELKYTKTHQWLKEEDGTAEVGITEYAANQLSGIVFVDLPEVGDNLSAGEPFAQVESVKVVADVHSPISGKVTMINETLVDDPQTIDENPYNAWFIKADNITETVELMTAEEYRLYIESLK